MRKDEPFQESYALERMAFWDMIARQADSGRDWGLHYHRRLTRIFRHLVPRGRRVLEIGCGFGDLLAAVEPSVGVGVDFSGEMIDRAVSRHPQLRFLQQDAHNLELQETFDVVILSDLINDLFDVQRVFERVRPMLASQGRMVLNFYSRLWEIPLAVINRLGMANPVLNQNWFTPEDTTNILHLSDFEVIRHMREIMFPLGIPVLDPLCNRFLVKLWPLKHLALTNIFVARSVPNCRQSSEPPVVSVIVPARNEAGYIPEIFERTPEMGKGTELIFVEGHSKDDTFQVIEQNIAEHPQRRCFLFRQEGEGKGDAARLGFSKASGEVLMILDADLTVPPEDLPRFLQALLCGKGELINGVRLVYPMEGRAMRFLNLVGNKFFSLAFSWLLGQSVKDTLCGTKVLFKRDYELIAANRSYFGDFDPFGDFDLLFGAAKLNLKIVDMPVRYRSRTYGETNISRFSHGRLLFEMLLFAASRIKFV